MPKQRMKQIAFLAVCGLLIVGLAVFLWRTGILAQLQDTGQLQETISAYGASAALVFFLLQLCSVIFAPIPSNVVALAGGGWPWGSGRGF